MAFISHDYGNGLSLGAQVLADNDFEQVQAYVDYDFAKGNVGFTVINSYIDTGVEQFIELTGRYQVYNQISAIAGVRSADIVGGDSTTEYAVGAQYDFGDGVAAQLQYVKYDAFNGFSGDGYILGVTYALGKKRKSGYQPIAKTFAKSLSPVFRSF